jgi:rubrerythrin
MRTHTEIVLSEAATGGVIRALTRRGPHKTTCKECAYPLPVYPGRYPKSCPNCGTAFEAPTPAEPATEG